MAVLEAKIMDETVAVGTGKVYTDEFQGNQTSGFSIRTASNVGSGNVVATLTLESYDATNGWAEEPQALFDGHPTGSAQVVPDTFTDIQAEKYRVGVDPSAGSGPVTIVQTENQID